VRNLRHELVHELAHALVAAEGDRDDLTLNYAQEEYQCAVPYDLRASFVSLLVWEGSTMLEVAAQAGHGVDVCETYYARVFEGYDPAKRTSAEAAIRAARQGQGPAMDLIRREHGGQRV
jgi:hypothetical protein